MTEELFETQRDRGDRGWIRA